MQLLQKQVAILFWPLILLTFTALSQVRLIDQKVVESPEMLIQTTCIPTDSMGVLLVQHSQAERGGNEARVQLRQLSTNFQKKWQHELLIDKKLQLSQYKLDDFHAYLVFSNPNATSLKVIRTELGTGKVVQQQFYSFPDITYYDIELLAGNLYLLGAKGQESLLFRLDMAKGSNQLLPTDINGPMPTVIKNLQKNERHGMLIVTLASDGKKKQQAAIRMFDAKGQKLQDFDLPLNKSFRLLEANFIPTGANPLVVGTYTFKNNTQPEGVFSFIPDKGKINYFPINQAPFADAENGSKPNKGDTNQPNIPFMALGNAIVKGDKVMLPVEHYDLVSEKTRAPETYHSFPNMKGLWASTAIAGGPMPMSSFTAKIENKAAYSLKYFSIFVFDLNGQLSKEHDFKFTDDLSGKMFKRLEMVSTDQDMLLLDRFSGNLLNLSLQNDGVNMIRNENTTDKDGNLKLGSRLLQATHWYQDHYLNITLSPKEGSKGMQLTLQRMQWKRSSF